VIMLQHILIAGILGTATASAGIAQAQTGGGHDHHSVAPAAQSAAEMSEGEVRKLDLKGKKITLKHGPLKNLDMPAMTMAFQVTDAAMLGKVKVGDKVRFVAANPGGKLTVTDIQLAQK
jgi:Cu(I)/Ag(I) efflux system periplasmic protein CusF